MGTCPIWQARFLSAAAVVVFHQATADDHRLVLAGKISMLDRHPWTCSWPYVAVGSVNSMEVGTVSEEVNLIYPSSFLEILAMLAMVSSFVEGEVLPTSLAVLPTSLEVLPTSLEVLPTSLEAFVTA
jgi:hypothetical protein